MLKHLRFLSLFLVLIPDLGLCQEKSTLLNGRVKSFKNDVSNVLVINLNSRESTITDSLGLFTIEVKLKDSLRVTAVQYLKKEILITEKIFSENSIVIRLVENIIDLDEVTVTPYNLTGKIDLDLQRLEIEPTVTSSTLGLPNANVEKMSQSERMLLEADRGKYIRLATIEDHGKLQQVLGYATLSIIINTHKIMNRVSGRTKSLEERVTRDKNVELENEIIALYSKETLSEDFNIPEENIDGFLTYCMSQKDFSKLSQVGNTLEIWEYLKAKSVEFKSANSSEKK